MFLYVFFILGILAYFLILMLFNTSKVFYLKKLFLPIGCILFILSLIIFSSTAVKAASKGLSLWMNIVFPSLFPFFVGSELLLRSGFVRAFGVLLEPLMRPLFNVPGCGSFAFAMGISSGYPVGAKITTDMRQENLITKIEAERLLSFTNNSGPLFIIGAVSVGMFKMPQLGLFLLGCHISACITVGIIFRFHGRKEKSIKIRSSKKIIARAKDEYIRSQKNNTSNFGGLLGDAIRNSITTILAIGGFIILFSVIINILIEMGFIDYLAFILSGLLSPLGLQQQLISSLLGGFFEITTGSSMVSSTNNIPLIQQIAATSMVLGWAGMSVHSQVLSIISKSDISIKPYLFGKLLQGVFAAAYTVLAIKVFGTSILGTKQVFLSLESQQDLHWYNYFFNSFEYFLISLTILSIIIGIAVILHPKAALKRKKLKSN
jgi:sporulation integral membrane protein YlbJ